jgi:hypothetical protein
MGGEYVLNSWGINRVFPRTCAFTERKASEALPTLDRMVKPM